MSKMKELNIIRLNLLRPIGFSEKFEVGLWELFKAI